MQSVTHLSSALLGSSEIPTVETMAKVVFEGILKLCLAKWRDNTTSVVLHIDMEGFYGKLAADYFRRDLAAGVGGPVTLSTVDVDGGLKTLVQMPEYNVTPMQSSPVLSTDTLQYNAVQSTTSAASVKKAPRPMNCWLLFRDATHKKMKLVHPELSVQQISKECSKIWRNLTPKQKKHWQDAAQVAKEEHKRMHPDYKYSPRKPGEKKKRQSRKAKQAAAVATTAAGTPGTTISEITTAVGADVTVAPTVTAAVELQPFDFNSPLDSVAFDNASLLEVDFGRNYTDVNNTIVNDFGELTVSSPVEQEMISEYLRQGHLYNEFDGDSIMNDPFDMTVGDHFALGADVNATLPLFPDDI